mmetsp:Transcript_10544/g.32420  ORF Transcript_10544/g.32420 Transcript_10544/m.32420 type:complete len:147 (+) Transcript_10544:1236-1676(+)
MRVPKTRRRQALELWRQLCTRRLSDVASSWRPQWPLYALPRYVPIGPWPAMGSDARAVEHLEEQHLGKRRQLAAGARGQAATSSSKRTGNMPAGVCTRLEGAGRLGQPSRPNVLTSSDEYVGASSSSVSSSESSGSESTEEGGLAV